ncbi:TetR/AcrR family transcriptional regulator [Mycoplasmatota bacterium zrk1]
MYHKINDKRAVRSKEWIYQALIKLIYLKKYENITVTDIIKKAGVGRSTFYRNYDLIDDVLLEHLDNTFEDFYSYIFNENFKEETDISPQLFIPFFSYWDSKSEILEIIIRADKLSFINDRMEKSITKVINTYKIFDNFSKTDNDYAVVIMVGILQSVLVKWIKDGKKISTNKLAEIVINSIFK